MLGLEHEEDLAAIISVVQLTYRLGQQKSLRLLK